MRKEQVVTTTDVYHIESMEDFDQPPHQATLHNVLASRMHISDVGYCSIKVPDNIFDEIIQDVVRQIGGRRQGDVEQALRFNRPSHWAIDRFIYSPAQKRFVYVAGQDQSWEMNDLRKYLYK